MACCSATRHFEASGRPASSLLVRLGCSSGPVRIWLDIGCLGGAAGCQGVSIPSDTKGRANYGLPQPGLYPRCHAGTIRAPRHVGEFGYAILLAVALLAGGAFALWVLHVLGWGSYC